MCMKNIILFILYFLLGVLLVFSFKKANQIFSSRQLKTPIATSSFSLNDAPNESLRGTIVSLSGEVGWQSRIATEPAQINKPIQIQQGEGIVTNDTGQATVVFSKTANIIIAPKTVINFIQTLPVNILIEQNSGTAKYEKLSGNSLSVRSQGLLIKINQGVIDISVSENQPYVFVDVKSGSITAGYNDVNYITQVLNVASDNRLVFRTDTKKASLVPLQ